MTTLSEPQIAKVALSVGLTPPQAVIATAIAMRESGGHLEAHNPVYPDDSYGLWQINRLAHAQYSPEMLQTAGGNAQAMLEVSSHGTNWQPWQIGGNPLARTDPAAAQAAVSQAVGGNVEIPDIGSAQAGATLTSALQVASIGDMVGTVLAMGKWAADPHNWVRIVEGGAGIGAIIIGVIMMGRDLK